MFPDASRRCDSLISREIVLEGMNEVQKKIAVWRYHMVQLEADVADGVPGGLGA